MSKLKKFFWIILLILIFIGAVINRMPAWIVGSIAAKVSNNHVMTRSETGTFWNGAALLVASDKDNKKIVPMIYVNWKVKLGLAKFVTIDLMSSGQSIANVSLTKDGLDVTNVNLGMSMDQLAAFAGNLSTLNLSGSAHVMSNNIHLGKSNTGSINVTLTDIGSGMSPVNPIGNYNLTLDLAAQGIDVSSEPSSVIKVTGSGNTSGLALNARVDEDKKEQMLQFMTMMGIPQGDGSYLLKVF